MGIFNNLVSLPDPARGSLSIWFPSPTPRGKSPGRGASSRPRQSKRRQARTAQPPAARADGTLPKYPEDNSLGEWTYFYRSIGLVSGLSLVLKKEGL